jgi:hypothetical protein
VVSAYAVSKPKLIINGDLSLNSWTDAKHIQKMGYMIVSDKAITQQGVSVRGHFVQQYHAPYTKRTVTIYWAIVKPATK